jgi:hypothetical protein
MIAADTSTWVAYLEGAAGNDAELLRRALVDKQVLMVPAVLAELLSDPDLPPEVGASLVDLPLIQITPGYWPRVGRLRAKAVALRRRARLGDALIAQCCADEGVPLITRDRDFRVFSEAAGVDLLIKY